MKELKRNEVLVKNSTLSKEELESLTNRLKLSGKPSRIAGSFNSVLELDAEKLRHFKGAPYVWKQMNGKIYGGMLCDESLDYIHLVLASEEVVEYLLNL
jgi:hypothetical protein